MYTEEEAKELWCPHIRHAINNNNPSSNAVNDGAVRVRSKWNACIGSKCSQWRWNYRIVFPENEAEEEKKQNWFWGLFEPTYPTYALPPKLEKSDKGYCGLAGKP
jgi:hypothetical protein